MGDPKLRPGSNHCLCSVCGEYFTSDYTFRMHRAGKPEARYCRKPGSILDKQRRPKLRRNDSGLWTSNRFMDKHWEEE